MIGDRMPLSFEARRELSELSLRDTYFRQVVFRLRVAGFKADEGNYCVGQLDGEELLVNPAFRRDEPFGKMCREQLDKWVALYRQFTNFPVIGSDDLPVDDGPPWPEPFVQLLPPKARDIPSRVILLSGLRLHSDFAEFLPQFLETAILTDDEDAAWVIPTGVDTRLDDACQACGGRKLPALSTIQGFVLCFASLPEWSGHPFETVPAVPWKDEYRYWAKTERLRRSPDIQAEPVD